MFVIEKDFKAVIDKVLRINHLSWESPSNEHVLRDFSPIWPNLQTAIEQCVNMPICR